MKGFLQILALLVVGIIAAFVGIIAMNNPNAAPILAGIGLVAVVIILILVKKFGSTCPKCKERQAIEKSTKYAIGSKRTVNAQRMGLDGKKVWEKYDEQQVMVEYRCKKCGHSWEKKETQRSDW